jgi:CRISPR/Cas system-associated exonuclease Cas4 (RecB family)
MSHSEILQNSITTFHTYMDNAIAERPGEEFRAGGRATKANPNKEDETWWRINGPKQVEAWVEWQNKNPNLEILDVNGTPAIEIAVSANLDGVTLKGYIDRVFVDKESGELLIVDLKTGSYPPASQLQLGFYRVALEQTVGLNPQYGAYWMARQGVLSQIEELWHPTEMITAWLRQTKQLIDDAVFLPHITNMCKSCGVREFCYAVNKSIEWSEK